MAPRRFTLTEPLLKTECLLGEGPLWDARLNTLHFVDIERKRVYHYHPESGEVRFDQFDDKIGCLAIRKKGGLACAAQAGFAVIEEDKVTGKPAIRYLIKPLGDIEAHVRFNDGACDSRGRFWAGHVHSGNPPIPGALWRFDPRNGSAVMIDNTDIVDSNGIAWSEDDKTLYFTNSQANAIYAYDYDIETGNASHRRVHIDASAQGLGDKSFPDGLCMDSDGGIWSAKWGGSKIARFARDGTVDVIVDLPTVYLVTACAFGGPNLDQLYITTANAICDVGEFSDNAIRHRQFPDGGNLFVLDLKGEYREGRYRHEFLE